MTDLAENHPQRPHGPIRKVDMALASSFGAKPLRVILLYAALIVQFLSAVFFLGALWSEVLGLRTWPIPWVYQEYIQTLASLGMVVGVITSSLFLRHSRQQVNALGQQIEVVSGNFQSHMDRLFDGWNLSSSERTVAILAMKGFSNREIADLRGKSASTIKTQLNAVFRKSGLTTRQQLTAFLVEELMSGIAVECETGR